MRQVYGIAVLAYGACLLVATFVWRAIPFAFVRSESASAIAFAISVALSIPFVTTYTRLGLNCAEGEKPSSVTKARHAALKAKCPLWPIAWYGSIGFVAFVWLGCPYFQLAAHPFFAFSGVISSLTGIWLLFAYPVAEAILGGERGRTSAW